MALTYTTFDTEVAFRRGHLRLLFDAVKALFQDLEAVGTFEYKGTVTWSGSGATLAHTVTGVVAGDLVFATIRVKPTQAAYLVRAVPSTDTITFELSAANTGNDAQISYLVLRPSA